MPHVLSEGTVDLTLAPPVEIPEWAAFKFLFKSRLVAVARKGCPTLASAAVEPGRTIPTDLFCALPQAVCSTDGSLSTRVDAALHARGRKRRVVLTMPHFHAIALAVAQGHVIGSLLPCSSHCWPAPVSGSRSTSCPPASRRWTWACIGTADTTGTAPHIWLRDQVEAGAREIKHSLLLRAPIRDHPVKRDWRRAGIFFRFVELRPRGA